MDPKGIVLAGTTVLSPVVNMKWQMIDRYVHEVMGWGQNGNGNVTAAEVAQAFGSSFLADVGFSKDELHPKNGCWSERELTEFFSDRYENEKRNALSNGDDTPYPLLEDGEQTFIAASNRWYKQWFLDETPTLQLLYDFAGDIALHYGEIDRQVSVGREELHIERCADKMRSRPKLVVHPKRGHALALSKPVAGPMDEESEDLLVSDILDMLRTG